MLSDPCSNALFTAVFKGDCPDIGLIKLLLRRKLACDDIAVDLFTYEDKTLLIAYPTPPRSACADLRYPRRGRHHF